MNLNRNVSRSDDKSTDESIESNINCNESETSVRKKSNNNLNYGTINDVIQTISTGSAADEQVVVNGLTETRDVLFASSASMATQSLSHSSRLPRLGLRFSDDIHSHSDTDMISNNDSINGNKSDIRFDSNNWRWWTHPQVKTHCKVFLAAFGLLIVGMCLLSIGIVVTIYPEIGFQSYVFFIAGIICFIPGAYHVVYVYCAVRGKRGYDFHQLPLFN